MAHGENARRDGSRFDAENGVNAVYKAAALSKLEGFRFSNPAHGLMGQATLNVGTIHGGLNINSVPTWLRSSRYPNRALLSITGS